jgi:hypothetical protein
LGRELREERIAEGLEIVALVFSDDEVKCGEAVRVRHGQVFAGVLGDAGVAFGGDRAGGMLRVETVSGDLSGGCHKLSFRCRIYHADRRWVAP